MPIAAATLSADDLVADLNEAQREAVLAASGPVAILAGAGTGKTRVISRRAAYAVATDVVPVDQVLVVTFTDRAANEMVERLGRLGLPRVTARTFHAHALSQLRHFWPGRHGGLPLPQILDSKLPIIVPLARVLPGHLRFTPAKDLADEIEWAKSRRIAPAAYEAAAADAGREPPIPPDLMANLYRAYERAKERAGRLDFDDMLTQTVELLETDEAAAAIVRNRKRWISVDEYQDTNPLQERLLELWAGDSPDVCVVGDEDQTIFTFTGATSAFLTGFAARHPGSRVVTLSENYRSSPQVLALANRLLAADGRAKRLMATRPSGPEPVVERHPSAEAELAALVDRIGSWLRGNVAPSEVAVLVRTNAQLAPIEEALTRAGIAYQVRGTRFYDRPDVRGAVDVLRRAAPPGGPGLPAAIRSLWQRELGFGEAAGGDDARERTAALETLLAILGEVRRTDPDVDVPDFLAELDRRRAHERSGAADGVNLLTLHRAKGLEWDAVALPMLEEGSLPIRPNDDDAAIAEERRLLYVGLTRARVHLALSWAERRESRGKEVRRRKSRFLEAITPPPKRFVTEVPAAFDARTAAPRASDGAGDPVFEALRAWRLERARADSVSAFVVAHDSMLRALADARPASLAQLRRVPGMGPTKLERYGPEILDVLRRAAPTDA